MKLEGRLGLIRDMLSPCDCLCDVGTDHALIPAAAVMEGICRRALATDIRPGPLERAARTLRRYRLEDRIELRLGAGLEPVRAGECDGIVIAGMGALMICDILANHRETAERASFLILQPMHAQERLRPWLRENGYVLLSERLAREGEKRYQVLAVRHRNAPGTLPFLSADMADIADISVMQEKGAASDLVYPVPRRDFSLTEEALLSTGPAGPELPEDPEDPLYDCVGYEIVRKPDPLAALWVGDWIVRQRRIAEGLQRSGQPSAEAEDAARLLAKLEDCLAVLNGKEPKHA